MKELKTKTIDLFISNGSFQNLQKRFKGSLDINGDVATYLSDKVDDLYREEKKFQKYIEVYSEIFVLKGFALLEAEGDDLKTSLDEGYRDGKRIKNVQSWVNKHDGEYACLFLCISDISEYGAESARSLLFIPDRGVSDTVFSLFSPLHRHIDMYTIDYYLNEVAGLRGLSPDKIEAAIKKKRYKEWMQVSERIGGCSK